MVGALVSPGTFPEIAPITMANRTFRAASADFQARTTDSRKIVMFRRLEASMVEAGVPKRACLVRMSEQGKKRDG
jgi:hypothetical protein